MSELLHLIDLRSQRMTEKDFYTPMLVVKSYMHTLLHSSHFLSCLPASRIIKSTVFFSKRWDTLSFCLSRRPFQNSNVTFSALWRPRRCGKKSSLPQCGRDKIGSGSVLLWTRNWSSAVCRKMTWQALPSCRLRSLSDCQSWCLLPSVLRSIRGRSE